MTDRKLRVSFIYKESDTITKTSSTYYHILHGLGESSKVDLVMRTADREFDIGKLPETDIILLPENGNIHTPDLIGIQNSNIPVFCFAGDVHDGKIYSPKKFHEKYKIDHYFSTVPESVFYKYYPKKYKYSMILFGLSAAKYRTVRPFDERIKQKLLVSGVMPVHSNPFIRAVECLAYRDRKTNRFHLRQRRTHSLYYCYALRNKCGKLPYVEYRTAPFAKYAELLSEYRASIAAATLYPVRKHLESTAAGCLTFMEITKRNGGAEWGFKDGENAIFIDEKNYKKKFEEYLADVDNPKWAEIAAAGREYVMNNVTTEHAVDKLVDVMWGYIK